MDGLFTYRKTKKPRTFRERIGKCLVGTKRRIQSPSLSFISSSLSVISLIVAAVCISVISETLYHRTLSSFAQASLNACVSRVVYDTTNSLSETEHAVDGMVYATLQTNRILPSSEDAELNKSGVSAPLGPSVATRQSGEFSYKLGSQIPNSTLTISTWRNYFGTQMSTLKLSSRSYFTNFDMVFSDGAFLAMETKVQFGQVNTGIVGSSAVLFDGTLLRNETSNQSSYYVRNTILTNGFAFGFDRARIVPSSLTDRRQEHWYKQSIPDAFPNYDVSSRSWLGIQINTTTGSASVLLVGKLISNGLTVGRARVSYLIDQIGWFPTSYWDWIPMKNIQIYTISHTNELIIGAEEFSVDTRRSLYKIEVALSSTLSVEEQSMGCELTPSSPTTQTKTCRHTISTFNNRPLQIAREITKASLTSDRFYTATSDNTLTSGRSFLEVPSYKAFECDGDQYFVSWAAVSTNTASGSLQWVTMAIVPQREVTGVLTDVRAIVIAVTAAIIVFLAIVFAVGTRIAFQPIIEISELLSAAAYLSDGSDSAGSFSHLTDVETKEIATKVNDRSLSRWAEVRAIQQSYWSMSDELKALKAYIPAHLREEIVSGKHHHQYQQPDETSQDDSDSSNPLASVPIGITTPPPAPQPPAGDIIVVDTDAFSEAGNAEVANGMHMSSVTELVIESPTVATTGEIPVTTNRNTNPEKQEAHPPLTAFAAMDQSLVIAQVNKQEEMEPYHPIFFADSCLIDRDITVVHLNFISFHQYARRRHPTTISSDYAEFITYINAEVKRFGGVLESFFGDKIWVSFNATSKCVRHQVAACYFAHHVTCVTNSAALKYQEALPTEIPADGSKLVFPAIDKRFAVCVNGINCGVSTGRAFVGPLGNAAIKRHSIISNAISEAVALERQTLHYTGCNVFVSSEMLPHIEGYCQYMLLDASLLPGSLGKRRLIACIMGPMLGATVDGSFVRKWLKTKERVIDGVPNISLIHSIENPLVIPEGGRNAKITLPSEWVEHTVPNVNRFASVNEGFRAILRGQAAEANRWLQEMKTSIATPDNETNETPSEYEERKAMVSLMILLIETIMAKGVDARKYTSTLGDSYMRST